MSGQLDQPGGQDPARLRVSDAERHQVAEMLREAAGEGRLDLTELDERLDAAYAARTYADLVPITMDLPGAIPGAIPSAVSRAPAAPSRFVAGPDHEQHLAIMSGVNRRGTWTVPRAMSIVAMMGGADLDLRQARFAAREVTITVNCFMGGAQITVGPDIHVVMSGTGIMGGFQGPSDATSAARADSPVLHVRGVAIWGGVAVRRVDQDTD